MDLQEAITAIENAMNTVKIEKSRWSIVVLDKGFVVVGEFSQAADGVYVIANGAFVRRWGTTRGLGEIQDGPTKETKLDPCNGPLRFTNYILSLDASRERWADAY